MVRVLSVSKSGYFEWRARKISHRLQRRVQLKNLVQGVFDEFHKIFGYRKITRELLRRGHLVSENTVRGIMKELGIRPKFQKKFKATTDSNHSLQRSPDLVQRNFNPEKPGEILAGDITEVPTGEGKLYLAMVKDLCTKEICGWSMADHMRAQLPIEALENAIRRNRHIAKNLTIFHSDQGRQYASEEFRTVIARAGLRQSMGTRGDCYDNASAETFFGFLKREYLDHMAFQTLAEAKAAIFYYIEIFYNRKRLHAAIGYVPPMEYAASFTLAKAA